MSEMDAAAAEPETEVERLRREVAFFKTCGIVELAVINPNVMDYMKHWEGRAERAEDELSRARYPDLTGS